MVTKTLVLGFYDRHNLGDEQYKETISLIYPNCTFQCMDDATVIPDDITYLVIGGGDVINEYFMSKLKRLLLETSFQGLVTAFSVGIPYPKDDAKYLRMFDHVFARTSTDYDIACSEIGSRNVTLIPDAAWLLHLLHDSRMSSFDKFRTSYTKTKYAVCLAQPVFYYLQNSNFVNNVILFLKQILDNGPTVTLYFVPFNTNQNNSTECDIVINEYIIDALITQGYDPNRLRKIVITDVHDILDFFNYNIDMVIGMRLHSLILSMITETPCISFYRSSKIQKLLDDMDYRQYGYNFGDESFDPEVMYNIFLNRIAMDVRPYNQIASLPAFRLKNEFMDPYMNKYKEVFIKRQEQGLNFDVAAIVQTVNNFIHSKTRSPFDVAEFATYIITNNMNNDYIWGFADNYENDPNFNLTDSIQWVCDDYNKKLLSLDTNTDRYLPIAFDCVDNPRKSCIDLNYINQDIYSGVHRSGWSYVVDGLRNLDSEYTYRHPSVIIDTYVDRTFHWGSSTFFHLGKIPYTLPWMGFIHHTFDETQSEYNCVQLFRSELFLSSLQHCKGLFVLSRYLKNQIELHMQENNISHRPPVYALVHAMDYDHDNVFSMPKFLLNPNKKLVNIGFWLRNPFKIYEIPLTHKNAYSITKCVLNAKHMTQYLPPSDLENALANLASKYEVHVSDTNNNVSEMCNPPTNRKKQKFVIAMNDSISTNLKSVTVINHLNNAEYDNLLAENIVFLNLVDASACNTVIECIVRNTPLLVNRLPALEELLGMSYPGFYNDVIDVVTLINSIDKMYEIHTYLTTLDKSLYTITKFVLDVQNAVCIA